MMIERANLRTIYLIKRAELLVRSRLEAGLRDLGVTVAQYAVLSLLAVMPESSSAQIARSVGVTPQAMAETIASFERLDLIRRAQSNLNKRILAINLTPKGLSLLKQCDVLAGKVESSLFSRLCGDELDSLRTTLHLILSDEI
jgi:DNA-binding MarR family transcriptional regulator